MRSLKRGHTEDRCHIKHGTWNSNGSNGQQQRIKNNPISFYSSATNMADSSSLPYDNNESDGNHVQGFNAEIIKFNNNGKSEAFINVAGLFAHNSSDSQLFTHISSSFISNVNLPTGSTATMSSTGTIKFKDNNTLKNVLCVPSLI